jgi:cytoskeletal protein CcmA (bactofilin family)
MADEKAPPCVLKPDAVFRGLVDLASPGRIDGRVVGEIIGTDQVWIGASARVKARITAPEIVIAGEVEGDASAKDRIELLSSARVFGDLDTPRLILAEGSLLEGSCRTDSGPHRANPDLESKQPLLSS